MLAGRAAERQGMAPSYSWLARWLVAPWMQLQAEARSCAAADQQHSTPRQHPGRNCKEATTAYDLLDV